ncbi:MAG: HAD family hydrolase [Helicobacter sp.]|nr:HAD family hydrolase [Helicobacter sp.]
MKAVFFDRDGVINEDLGYVSKIADFTFKDGIFELLEFFKKRNYNLFVVTNQSGIGRGFYSMDDFFELSIYMQTKISERLGFSFDKIYFCPHIEDDNCDCRKPKSGMILQARDEFKLDLSSSFLIGDKISDIEAAKEAGIGHKILLSNETHNNLKDVLITSDLKSLLGQLEGKYGKL